MQEDPAALPVAPPIAPPIDPMLARLADELPTGEGFLYEPKWDGFRAIVFRGASTVFIQSRDLRPLDRYFPELHEALLQQLPDGCVVDAVRAWSCSFLVSFHYQSENHQLG